jgi:membrane fusion protein (multidrug efflux system)
VVEQLKPTEQGFAEDASKFQPQLKLSDGTTYGSPGKITFLDNSLDATTGTIAVYAEFANPALQLIPGQYVSVTVQEGQAQQLPIIAASAVQLDQQGNYVFVLGENNVATIRRVTLGVRVGTNWSVASGLAAGDVVIVSGIQKIRAGVTVKPQPAAGN